MNDMELLNKSADVLSLLKVGNQTRSNMLLVDDLHGNLVWWDPLNNDADAFYIATELRLKIVWDHKLHHVKVGYRQFPSRYRYVTEKYSHTAAASLRRAIVRTAAAIYEAMELASQPTPAA